MPICPPQRIFLFQEELRYRGAVSEATWQHVGSAVNFAVQIQAPRSEIWLSSSNGWGSVATGSRRFANQVKVLGTDVTYLDDPSYGATFTINSDGVYTIQYSDVFTSYSEIGIGYNNFVWDDTIPTGAHHPMLVFDFTSFVADTGSPVTVTANLKVGDVVYALSSRSKPDSSNVQFTYFRITKCSG